MKNKHLLIIIALIIVYGTESCSGDKPPSYPYSTIDDLTYLPDYHIVKSELLQDIDQYLKIIHEVHADPYRQITQSDLNKFADSLKRDIIKQQIDSLHLFDCYYYLQLLSAKIEDGHTLIRKPANWRKINQHAFPLVFKDISDTLIIEKIYEETAIPIYAEVITINNQPINVLKRKTSKYISGTLSHYKTSIWAKELPFFIQTYFKLGPPWIIKYRFNNAIYEDTIHGLPYDQFINILTDDYYSNLITIDSFQIGSGFIPSIKLNAFNYKSYPDYTALIDSFFTVNREKECIIIDISENTGGNGIWSLFLLDYLADSEYSTYNVYENRISQQFKKWAKYQLQSIYFSEGKPANLFWFYSLVEDELYYKDILRAKKQTYVALDKQYHTPHERKYLGKVILLISEETWSAGVVFASIFCAEKMGYIIGSETGGRIGFNSDPINIELCNTKLVAKIPTAILALPGSNKDRGQKPDLKVIISIKELQNNTNPYIQTIKKSDENN